MRTPLNAVLPATARQPFACALALLSGLLATPLPPAHADSARPGGLALQLIDHYHMQRIPQEGAWFSLTYASDDQLGGAALPARYAGRAHAAGSAIVVVETRADFSAMHRLRTDEVWHFYGGSPLELVLLYPDGHGRTVTMGPNVLAGHYPQFTVPRGVWQGSAPRDPAAGAYSFLGTQLSPGFDYADFEIGYRDQLQHDYPAFAQAIGRLTRAEFATRPAPGAPQSAAPPPSAVTFRADRVPAVATAPGVDLQELVGRVAADARSTSLSVAQFTLSAGRATAVSYNQEAQEVFLVANGTGLLHLDASALPVGPSSVVFIPAGQQHSIEADASGSLQFFAISAPAFTPEDYVVVKP